MDIKQYQAFIQHAPYGFAYHRILRGENGKATDYRFLEANDEFGRLTGLDPSKIKGKTVREALSEIGKTGLDWVSFYEQLKADLSENEDKQYSESLGLWYQVQTDAEEKDRLSIFFFKKIESLKLKQKLYNSEYLFKHLIQNTQVALVVLSKEYKFLYKESFGGRERLTGLPISVLNEMCVFDLIHPDDREYAKSRLQWMKEHPGKPDTYEIRIKNRQGAYTWLEIIGSNMPDFLDLGGYIMIGRDISKRKAIEAALLDSDNRLRYISNNVRDIVFLTDKELNAIYVSPSVQDVLGLSPEQQINTKLEDKFTPRSLQLLYKLLKEELANERDPNVDKNRSRIVELQQYKADGSILDVATHVSIVRDENGEYNGLQGVSRDITQQKRTECELKEKNQYIESLLSAIPDLMFVTNQDGVIIDVKSGHEASLYMPKEQVLGSHMNEVLPENLAKKLFQKNAEVLRTGKTGHLQYQLMIKGVLEDYEVRISPFGENQVISLSRNITEQLQTLAALQQQNQFQKMITDISTTFVKATVENIDQVLYESLARVGQYFDIHRAYIFRYSQDYNMLYNTNEWNAPELEPIQGMQKVYLSSNSPWWHKQIMSGKMVQTNDMQDLPPEAKAEQKIMQRFDIRSCLFVPIETGSRVLGYFGFDSIGKKHSFSESELGNLKVIANLLAEVLQKFDYERKMQEQAQLQELISGMALQYINLPTNELQDSIYDSLSELANFAHADRAFIFEYDWDKQICINTSEWCAPGISAQKENLQSLPLNEMQDWVIKHKAGETVIVSDLNLLDENDSVRKILSPQKIKSVLALPIMRGADCLGFVGVDFVRTTQRYFDTELTLLKLFAQLLVNIRNRQVLEEGLILEKERAEAANQAKSEFLANMSHEIRTPLNGVIGFTELLLNSSLSPSQQQYAQNIVYSSHSLLGIISDILDFSKIEAGKLELDLVPTDLIKLVEHATEIISIKTAKKNIELLLNIPVDLPRYAILDPLRVNQILINLLSNAEKFTEKGEIELGLSFIRQGKDRADIRFSVRDTGIGIGKAHKLSLFEAFTQLDSSTTRKYGGTGLGLVISNNLANLMGSKIELNSEVNKGSEFFFVINCQVEIPAHKDEYAPSRIKKAIVIDDNTRNRSILQDLLNQWGIESKGFANSINAMKYLEDQLDCDLIILDHQMPELGGIPTIKMIRQQMPKPLAECPIILLLSTSDDEAVQKAVQKLKIRYTLVKPVKADELMEILKFIDNNEEPSAKAEVKKVTSSIKTMHFEENPRILIAEDNALNLALLKEMISRQIPKAQIISAADGLEAVNKVKGLAPHIVLMDVQMPNLDGVNASIEIRKFSNIPIIAVTAGTLKEERERCLKAEMNDFLTKPVMLNDLRDILTKHLPLELAAAPKVQASSTPEDVKKHFNKAALLQNISGDLQVLDSLLETVLSTFPEKFQNIRQALEEYDETKLKAALHSLRGSALNMYFTELGLKTGNLEQTFNQISNSKRQEFYQEIESEWYKVKQMISEGLSI
ncbi:MAG: response regulator [Candidatus Cloacimonetes bacterium]|jgi:PAS domain S-box-containing protein|nr:response regulator [Candidatus Cloacimonadota bacterium]